MFYPVNRRLQKLVESFQTGNFGLWFNKMIPLTKPEECKPCDRRGNTSSAVEFYLTMYNQNQFKKNSNLAKLLKRKHDDQCDFVKTFKEANCKLILLVAELRSPLITGIGQPHPNEVGMVFDHTLGIPYIPASSVKGMVRFSHLLEIMNNLRHEFIRKDEDGEYIDESIKETLIPYIFGGELDGNDGMEAIKLRGKVIFLDAYPEKVPELHLDIMNPHYGEYYADESGKIPPADYLSPNPIKFLTVKKGTKFVFRTILTKNRDEEDMGLEKYVKKALKRALEIEGIGAKTSVGYGRFKIYEEGKIDQITTTENITQRNREIVWKEADLNWRPQNETLTATCRGENFKASLTGKKEALHLVPEKYHKRLFNKHKSVVARVTVDQLGKMFKIVKIHEPDQNVR